jgi:ribonuclease P protein component
MVEENRMVVSPSELKPVVPARLKKRPDFLYVAGGRKSHSALFTIQGRARAEPDGVPRVGLTVTKKVGNAVERNRIKRRLREALRLGRDLQLASSHDYVIVARRPLLSVPFREIGKALRMSVAKQDGGRSKNRAPRS